MPHLSPLRTIRSLALVICVALASSACYIEAVALNGSASEEWTRTYTLAPGGSLRISNTNGAIEVQRAEGTAVEVRATRSARAVTDEEAKKALSQVEIREDVSADSVRVESRFPSGWMIGRSHQVRYHVKIPAGLRATFETTNGGVRLSGVTGTLIASTTNGGVSAIGVGGSIEAKTTNGGVDIDLADATGDVTLRTVNGGVTLRLPAAIRASVNARCVNGGIDIDDLAFNGSVSRRSAEGVLNGPDGVRIEARTVNGGVRIMRRRT